MLDLDILTIDADIRKNFEEEIEKLPIHLQKLQDLEETSKNEKLFCENRLKKLLKKRHMSPSGDMCQLHTPPEGFLLEVCVSLSKVF